MCHTVFNVSHKSWLAQGSWSVNYYCNSEWMNKRVKEAVHCCSLWRLSFWSQMKVAWTRALPLTSSKGLGNLRNLLDIPLWNKDSEISTSQGVVRTKGDCICELLSILLTCSKYSVNGIFYKTNEFYNFMSPHPSHALFLFLQFCKQSLLSQLLLESLLFLSSSRLPHCWCEIFSAQSWIQIYTIFSALSPGAFSPWCLLTDTESKEQVIWSPREDP